jgi:hypothetical protein
MYHPEPKTSRVSSARSTDLSFVLVLLLVFRWSSRNLAQDLGVQDLVLLAELRVCLRSEIVHLVLVLVVQYRHRVEDQDHCWAS